MREILFRGKRADNNEWVHGYYVPDMLEKTHGDDVDWAFIREHRHEEASTATHYVKKVTVGQYIGLRDKNRREIYEGDIIQTYFHFAPGDSGHGISQSPFVVKWAPGRTAFRASKPEMHGGHVFHILDTIDFFEMQSELYEIIGNVYDNPGLLEKGGA
ncbi:MAG TPA: YopX family protein [Dissulfurispiraceae bacterium]|nr:YopX family protein [Dissulfurispiraceae bacterium]